MTIQEDSRICITILYLLHQSAHLSEKLSSLVSQTLERMLILSLTPQPQGREQTGHLLVLLL